MLADGYLLMMASRSLSSEMSAERQTEREGGRKGGTEKAGPLVSLLIRALAPPSSKPNYLPQAPSPNIITLGFRALT